MATGHKTVSQSPPGTGAPATSSETTETETVWQKNRDAFKSKRSSEFYDPCQEAANKSIKCMHRNGGDKEMCQDYFQAYRDCKKQWVEQRKAAKKGFFDG